MHELPLLKEILILLAVAIFTSLISHRLKLPKIVGYILGGMAIGPYAIGLIQEKELVDVMAEIGIVLLLFTIGIEFSISEIKKVGARGLAVSLTQVILTTLTVMGIAHYGFDFSLVHASFFGFVIALSSTAIVLRLYMDGGQMESPQGRLVLCTLLTQDMAIVPMVLFMQIFGQGGATSFTEVGSAFGLAIVAVLAIIVTAYYVVPLFLHQVVYLKSPEVLTMAGIVVCMGTAWISSHFGLSLALGAFIAGIVISESEYCHQITASVLPFRDIFNSIFFISIGMLIRLDSLIAQWLPIIILTLLIILLKSFLMTMIVFIMRYPLRIALIVGLGLAQVGEFSFVLLKLGSDYNLVDPFIYQRFLSAIVLSMILTPLFIKLAPKIASKLPDMMSGREEALSEITDQNASVINHVIIAGYGLMGQKLAAVLNKTGISYVILDLNHENIKKARKEGHTAYYGDASYPEVLKSLGITAAKVMVFALSDPAGTRRGTKIAKELNPHLHIIVRTKYMGEISNLSELGADQVVPEEFETSVEIFSRVLKEYKVPGNIIQNQIDMVRLEGYSMLRGMSLPMEKLTHISSLFAASVSENFYVEPGSPVIGKTLKELNIRGAGGANIIAVARGDVTKTNPPANFALKEEDILILLGSHAEIYVALDILQGKEKEEDAVAP